ncbi:hypothetical protein TRSC58_07158 [Trypanosoma rangeli SC58]|uniref:adenylate cyclase n=1 Tax=Trypanosoma rangeli SC58 TaxID=429131 RepID=A0A061ITS7_TRYRA|nr:hypothetical protein TRSC58_07158 [Trypanosoma rangeli SC58]
MGMAVWWERRDGWTHFGLRPPAAALCLLLALLQLLLLFAPHSAVAHPAAASTQVKVLLLKHIRAAGFYSLSTAFHAGVYASMRTHNSTAEDDVIVEFVEREVKDNEYAAVLEEVMRKEESILVLLAQFGDTPREKLFPVLRQFDLVSFAPLNQWGAVAEWNPNVYFLRASPLDEVMTLVRFAVTKRRVLRLGFMYLQDGGFGELEYVHARHVMSGMGYAFCGVFTVKVLSTGKADPEEFDAVWERFAATRPQAVIVFGSRLKETDEFIKRMLRDHRTAGAYLLAPFFLQDFVLTTWRAVVDGGVKFVPGRVFMTGVNPLAKDTRYEAIRRFQGVMRDYLAKSGQTDYADNDYFLKHDTEGELMVAGWIAGEVLAQALRNCRGVKDRSSFKESIFNQRRYLIDDFVFGDYGGECTSAAASQGAVCSCNQGSNAVYMKGYVEDYRAVAVSEGLMTFDSSDCYASIINVPPVFLGAKFYMSDSALAQTALSDWGVGFFRATAGHNTSWGKAEISMAFVASTLDAARDALESEMQSRRVHGVLGVVTEAVLDVRSVVFIDPLLLEPRLNRFRRHVIHLSPTLEQQLFVLAKYLGNTSVRSAHAVIRGEEAAAVAEVLQRSLVKFGASLRSPTLLPGGAALVDHLPAKGDVFVVGLAAGDVAAIAKHVASNGRLCVFVAFSEFALLHAEFVAAFAGGAGADRVVFATSLPHWNDAKSTSETSQEFIRTVINATQRTPLSLMGFAATRLLQTVLSRMPKVTAELLVDFFYKNTAVTVSDMQYGSFADGTACDAAGGAWVH